MQHVIIGAGPAGIIAAENLRKYDPSAKIQVIGDEAEQPYSRMALPYYLNNKIEEEGTYLRKSGDHFNASGIELVQDRVSAIDTKSLSLQTGKGGQLSFDKLLIATGSHPVRPPIPGMDLDGVHSCWTLEDGRNIAAKANKGSNVVLMGAGFIGCIVLEALASRGINLTVIEMEDRMVPRMMDQTAGNLIKKWCIERGVNVHTSTRVESIEESGQALKVLLDSGGNT